jgi:hypothetical protein
MKIFITLALLALSMTARAEVCFLSYEINDGGFTKVCVYSCVSGPASLTVSSVALCPLSVHR